MKTIIKKKSHGFTIVEAVAALTILVTATALALAGYVYLLKNANQGDVQNELDNDIQLAIERLKIDIRLSSMNEMFFYPAGNPPYTAMSFPIAYDSDGDGMIERDDDGIIWDETIIYHIRPGSPDELVRTTFSPRDETLGADERQAQLNSVVATGYGSKNDYNSANASSKTIFSNLLDWELNPRQGMFNGYAKYNKRETINLGYAYLDDNNPHTFTFKVIDKDADSTGYKVGFDYLNASSSLSVREAETQTVVNQDGASAVREYKSQYNPSKFHLLFPATAVGSEFTIELDNDRWEETNFGGKYSLPDKTVVEFRKDITPWDNVVQLEGMTKTWEATDQTGSTSGQNNTNYSGKVFRILHKGSNIADDGNFIRTHGQRARLTFQAPAGNKVKINHVFFGETSSSNNLVMDYSSGAYYPVSFSFTGSTSSEALIPASTFITTDWIDLPIDPDKNYMTTFVVEDADSIRSWFDLNADWAGTPFTTQMATPIAYSAEETAKTAATWTSIDTNEVVAVTKNYIPLLESIEVSYVAEGTYTSDIFDTKNDAPTYGDFSWNDISSEKTKLGFKIRAGDNPDLSDASDWSSITPIYATRSVPGDWKRYIQFQALMESEPPYLESPFLRDVTVEWAGKPKLVMISGEFSKGPDFGIFELSVDGKPLQSALIIDLNIYKDIATMDNKTRKATSSVKVELSPRNSDL